MDEGIFVPIVLFIVSGFVRVAWFWFNLKARTAVMDTVQKAMETNSDLSPDLLARLGAAFPSAWCS